MVISSQNNLSHHTILLNENTNLCLRSVSSFSYSYYKAEVRPILLRYLYDNDVSNGFRYIISYLHVNLIEHRFYAFFWYINEILPRDVHNQVSQYPVYVHINFFLRDFVVLTLRFDWETVSTAWHRRYPNPYSKHVLSEDVLSRYFLSFSY